MPPTSSAAPRRDARGGFPWAGLLALFVVLLLDHFALGVHGPWAAVAARIPAGDHDIDGGVALDQLAWAALDDPSDGRPRAVIVGSSRAAAGLVPDLLDPAQRDALRWLRMAHPGIEPFQVRSLAGPLADAHPELVVLLLSEFDTHRPFRLVPRANGEDLSAVVELVRRLPASVDWSQRDSLLRFTLGALWRPYRLREVFGAAGLAEWRSFARMPGTARGERPEWPLALDGGAPRPLAPRDAARVLEVIREDMPTIDAQGEQVRNQLGSHQAITRGPHADVQMAFVGSAVGILRGAGVRVLLVEGPLCPFPVPLYDLATRDEFRAFARDLARDDGTLFLSTDASGPFAPEDFRDPTHLGTSGATRLTRAMGDAALALLAR